MPVESKDLIEKVDHFFVKALLALSPKMTIRKEFDGFAFTLFTEEDATCVKLYVEEGAQEDPKWVETHLYFHIFGAMIPVRPWRDQDNNLTWRLLGIGDTSLEALTKIEVLTEEGQELYNKALAQMFK